MERPASRRRVLIPFTVVAVLGALAAPAAGSSGTGSAVFFERVGEDGTVDLHVMDGAGGHEILFFADAADIDIAPGR
jgi:hypothetical protein